MKSLEQNKGTVLAVIAIIAVVFLHRTFSTGGAEEITIDPTSETIGAEVVYLNQSIQSVTLSQNLFSTPAYKALIDFSTPLSQQPLGRTNPFDPI